MQTDLIEIQNIPCTVCQECGQEQIAQRVQKSIDKLLARAERFVPGIPCRDILDFNEVGLHGRSA